MAKRLHPSSFNGGGLHRPQWSFDTWLDEGRARGWISDLSCHTHQGIELTDEEAAEFEEGYDPCVFVLRVWEEAVG